MTWEAMLDAVMTWEAVSALGAWVAPGLLLWAGWWLAQRDDRKRGLRTAVGELFVLVGAAVDAVAQVRKAHADMRDAQEHAIKVAEACPPGAAYVGGVQSDRDKAEAAFEVARATLPATVQALQAKLFVITTLDPKATRELDRLILSITSMMSDPQSKMEDLRGIQQVITNELRRLAS